MMSRTSQSLVALGAALAVLIAACSEPDQPAAVAVSPTTVTFDAIGATQQLTATVTDKAGKTLTGAAVTWASSDASASVDQSGLVTAVASGASTVTASAGTVSGTATVTVGPTPAKVEAVSGMLQTGPVGQALPQQIAVRVADRLDHPIAGVAITFTLDPTGGTVAPASGTTGTDGQLAATWTVGTKTGSFQVAGAAAGYTVVFNAKVTAGPANNLAAVSGNNQFGYHDTRLAQLIGVRVRDQYGNGVPSYAVQFTTDPGNGTADSAIAFSDSAGVARTGWVMPSIPDTVSLQAKALSGSGSPLLGSPVTFTAISHNVNVTSTSPTTLLEGQSATLTGTGFDAGNTQNVVTIGGVTAPVTAASATDLTVTVPNYNCKPSRTVTVQVTVGAFPAAPVSRQLTAASPTLSLAVGQQAIFTDPAQFCFQLAPAAATESYLIGVQSTSEVPSNLTPITLVGTGAAAAGAPAFSPGWPTRPAQVRGIAPATAERLEWRRRYAAAEIQQRAFDRRLFPQLRSRVFAAPGAPRVVTALDSTKNVGDTVLVRVTRSNSCTDYAQITTVVQAKGTTNFILAEVANPTGGYSPSQFTAFSQQYDAKTYPTNAAEFGTPSDRDGNGRIVIVVTKEVNKRGPLGFTTSCDLAPRDSVNDPASNDGEIFYVLAPDPNGTVAGKYSLQNATRDFPDIIAHESVHVIQFGRRMAAGAAQFLDTWQAEGQAVLGEEVVGYAVEGHQTGQNLGIGPASNLDDTTSTDWYGTAFVGLGLYFGWDPITNPTNANGKLSNAPWECTWLDSDYGGPCVGGLDPYGGSWSLLRYLSDRFGNEAANQKAMIESPQTGFAAIQSIVGVRMDTLLAQWAAMLFADDSVPNAAAELKMASWNLKDVFYGAYTMPGGQVFSLYSSLRLAPQSVSFSSFTQSANVRAASAYYAVITGANRPAYALKARDASGSGILPSTMRYWVVRIQ